MQIQFVVFCALIATSYGYFLEGQQRPDHKVRWEPGSQGINQTQLIEVPMNMSGVNQYGWISVPTPENAYHQNVDMYCPEEGFYLFCVFLDQDNGFLAGNQISIPKANWNTIGDPSERGYYEWTAPDGTEHWGIAAYIVNEEYLASNATERLENYDHGQTYQLNKVWLTAPNNTLTEINADTANTEDNKYTNQTCIAARGQLMAYEVTRNTSCNNYRPMMPIKTQYNGMGGFVWCDWGSYNGTQSWNNNSNIFEQYWTADTFTSWFSDGPDCLTEYFNQHNVTSLSIYWVTSPKRISCN